MDTAKRLNGKAMGPAHFAAAGRGSPVATNPHARRSRFGSGLRGLVGLGLLLASGAASAALDYCVGTVEELDNALLVAGAPTGQTVRIKLRQGTYHVGASRLLAEHDYNAVQLLGGYNTDCSARTLRPSNTIIDGDGGYFHGFTLFGNLTIEGLRWRNLDGIAHALFFYASTDAASVTMTVRNNEFLGIGVIFSYFDPDGGAVGFNNNLVADAPTHGVWLQFDHDDVPSAGVTSNTIVNSAGKGILAATTTDYLNIFNNVVWNSGERDIWIEADASHNPGSGTFRNNLYDSLLGNEGPGSAGTLHDDPQFSGSGNYRLLASSPGVNSGTSAVALSDLDLDGHARVIGSTVDRGAYEALVDDTVPTTLGVTNTNDSGSGSLRQAILDANANPDFSFINFAIPGACPRTIALASGLPSITQGVRIDAFSQPGSAANTSEVADNATRCVILDGSGSITTGLDFSGADSTQFWLQGLAVGGFTGSGLRLSGGIDNLVWGNQFGGKVGTTSLLGNGTGISLTAFADSASIGGDAPAQRNVIANSSGYGIRTSAVSFFASSNNEIVGNLIGSWGNALAESGNGVGVWLGTGGNTVRDNMIINSTGDALRLEGETANGNTVEHNRIGRTISLCVPIPVPHCFPDSAPNLGHGIRLADGAHDNGVLSNTIWNSGQMGISVGGSGRGNRLSANSVYLNNAWGIDLDGTGLNDNDASAAAQGQPNRGLNYPIITRVYGGQHQGWVEGFLDSTVDSYLIQVFGSTLPDNQPNGEGELYLRTGIASIFSAPGGQNGRAYFRIAFDSPTAGLQGRSFALTAIDSDGNTSEFSFSAPYLCDVIFRHGMDNAEGDACVAQ